MSKTKKTKYSYKTIRLSDETKNKVDSFLKSINKKNDSGKITPENLINFFLENVTTEEIEKLKLSALTWDIEGARIRAIYENKFGKFTTSLWTQFIQTDEYRQFASQHSRLPLPWEQPLKVFQSSLKNKSLNRIIKNDTLAGKTA